MREGLPFIAQFARDIPRDTRVAPTRYNAVMDVSEVLIGSEWTVAASARNCRGRESRVTLVGRETTDDD